ncbi:hypothetical protein K439DRAFT_1619080 [Ramaria rubella]|nr:hypothetical protein K439DRAFT_1619080 [Ramaria rubella]
MTTTDTHTVLVTIPDCNTTHVLGGTSIPLTSGSLSLIKYHAAAPPALSPIDLQNSPSTHGSKSESPTSPVLTLQIGTLAFPLMRDTIFGTDATSPRVYLFIPELGASNLASQGGHIRLELPESAVVEGEGSRDAFEQVLIGEGLLKAGWEAVRDEIGRGVKDTIGGLRDKVVVAIPTESGRVPVKSLEATD